MRLFFIISISAAICNFFSIEGNPFAIDFPEKKELTNEDYVEVQRLIRGVDIRMLLMNLYRNCHQQLGYTSLEDFTGRCTRGTYQILIDPSKGYYPIRELVKIGKGGKDCIVTCGPYNGKYPNYVFSIIKGLEDQKFNGYFYYRIGGWPNPTGREIKYAAVPYSFKIFAMIEAQNLGFNNVLWVDSACYPVRKIDELFRVIEDKGALLNYWHTSSDAFGYIFPETHSLLKELTGTDVLKSNYINTIVFGLKMNSHKVKKLIETYYKFAEMGTPFLSCFPEEWVLTAIIGQKRYKKWTDRRIKNLVMGSPTNSEDSLEEFKKVRDRGGYFYHRKGR